MGDAGIFCAFSVFRKVKLAKDFQPHGLCKWHKTPLDLSSFKLIATVSYASFSWSSERDTIGELRQRRETRDYEQRGRRSEITLPLREKEK